MTWLQWSGVALIAWIVGVTVVDAIKAIRKKRFGRKYVKAKDVIGGLVALVMMSVFYYGWFKYPDAPIHECSGPTGFCGKQGQPHTALEFQQFEIWQTSLFVIWPMGMLIVFLINRKRPDNTESPV